MKHNSQFKHIDTGIPDVNGKIIREGDILEMTDPLPLSGKPPRRGRRYYKKGKVGTVQYTDGHFIFKISNTKIRYLTSVLVRYLGLKIINLREDDVIDEINAAMRVGFTVGEWDPSKGPLIPIDMFSFKPIEKKTEAVILPDEPYDPKDDMLEVEDKSTKIWPFSGLQK